MKANIRRLEAANEVNTELIERLGRLNSAIEKSISEAPTDPKQKELAQRYVTETALCVNTARGETRRSRPISNPYAPTYDDMIDSLVDQIFEKLKNEEDPQKKVSLFSHQLKEHKDRLAELLVKDTKEYNALIEERSKHIISDDLHTGFDSTMINKPSKPSTTTPKNTETSIEVINSPESKSSSAGSSSGSASTAPTSVTSGSSNKNTTSTASKDEDEVGASPTALEFSKIKFGDYDAAEKFLHKHPEIAKESEKDGLIMEAFSKGFAKDSDAMRRIIFNALIIQYCATLGGDGISLFFNRVVKPDGMAKDSFMKDVEFTINHIKSRVEILSKESEAEGSAEGQEVIQLQPNNADGGDNLTINIPPENSDDEQLKEVRRFYEMLDDDLRQALETKSLKKINEVLAEMSLEDAETAVKFFDVSGIFDIDGNVYEEAEFKEMKEREAKEKSQSSTDTSTESETDNGKGKH